MNMIGRIYISGPMTGIEKHNFPAFNEAAERFSLAGWDVSNPAENFDGRTDLPREVYLRCDVGMLAKCDAIALLPGWEKSKGATLEVFIAAEMGLRFFDAVSGQEMAKPPRMLLSVEPVVASILDLAKSLTEGARQQDYGHPCDDFERTAQMWTAILRHKLGEHDTVSAEDIPLCMIAVKLARQSHRHKRDNLVDICGYARTAAMVAGDE